jgi:predicted nicotinamide N-methyase
MAPVRESSPPCSFRTESAEALLATIAARYDVCTTTLVVAGSSFQVLRVSDTNTLLETINPDLFAVDERLPYWADLWASSVDLAAWCLQSGKLDGMDVLELGTGLGLAGVAATRAGAFVVMTDYEEDALRFARYNALVNLPGSAPEIRLMDWRAPNDGRRYHCILGSDIIYERRNFVPLLDVFGKLLKPGGTVLLTDPGRSTAKEFLSLARTAGFSIHSTSSRIVHFDRTVTVGRHELCLRTDVIRPE